ncbi:TPA: ankyrin repeat domain-containing protein [Legionella anisa]
MIKRTKKDEAFSYLSTQSKLQVELNKAKNDQEKFILYVKYASIIAQEEFLSSTFGGTQKNQTVKEAVIATIKWYLDKDIDVNTVDENNQSALAYAVSSPELVELFLSHGANPNLKSNSGNTPLHKIAEILTRFYTSQLLQSTIILTAAGADPGLKNEDGQTPIECVYSVIDKAAVEETRKKFLQATMPSSRVITMRFSGWAVLSAQKPELLLSQEDITDISLFEKGKYRQLLLSKPSYRHLKHWMNGVLKDIDSNCESQLSGSSEEFFQLEIPVIDVSKSTSDEQLSIQGKIDSFETISSISQDVRDAFCFFKSNTDNECQPKSIFEPDEDPASLYSLD